MCLQIHARNFVAGQFMIIQLLKTSLSPQALSGKGVRKFSCLNKLKRFKCKILAGIYSEPRFLVQTQHEQLFRAIIPERGIHKQGC